MTNEAICTMITNPQSYLLPLTEQNVHDQPEICSQQRWQAKIVALLMHRTEHQQMQMTALAAAFTRYADLTKEQRQVDLEEHHRLYTELKSEQKDLINSAAKEVFDRFNHGEDGRISQLEFCTLVQVSGHRSCAVLHAI